MKISYNVTLPERKTFRGGQRSEDLVAIESFLKGTQKNMAIEYDTPEEAKRRLGAIQAFRRKDPLGDLFEIYRSGAGLYIIRLDPKTVKAKKEARNMAAQKN